MHCSICSSFLATSSPGPFVIQQLLYHSSISLVETRIKEPTFIKTLRLKFNIVTPLNKNFSEAETGGGVYVTGFMSSFIRTFKNS